jgi:2-(1,2-epoxy-1,2-dihydrophenyl)acetyl-CoA isomerase
MTPNNSIHLIHLINGASRYQTMGNELIMFLLEGQIMSINAQASLEVITENHICWLKLNRPEVRNAWTAEMGDSIATQLELISRDDSIRAVVITGKGKGFCSGVDLRGHFDVDTQGVSDLRGMHHRRFMPAILALRRLPKPVICAINGASVGFGCSVAMASDFVLMAQSAVMIFAFAKIGLLPDGGATAMLVERVGPLKATEIAMLANDISADGALELGLVNRVCADDQLEAETLKLAERLASGPTRSYAAIKEAIQAWSADQLSRQMEREGDLLQRLARTHDFGEGKSAFVERRPAKFIGA